MTLYDAKAMKAATRDGGELGSPIRTGPGATVVHHIGDDWAWSRGQSVNNLIHYRDHIALMLKFSTLKFQSFVIPKAAITGWGLMLRRDIPMDVTRDRFNTMAYGLLFGPLGAILGSGQDDAIAQQEGERPVIAITYEAAGEEHAIFLEFPLTSWYRRAHELLAAALPDKQRG